MTRQEAEFDLYDQNYQSLVEDSIGFSGVNHDYVTRVKADLIAETVAQRLTARQDIAVLDVGCGVGLTDVHLVSQPWRLAGTDISSRSVDQAKQRNPSVEYRVGEPDRLPFDDETFDLCFTICVMHHVPPAAWIGFLKEMKRVLRPGGLVMVIEHNPFNPLTRLVVNRCPFDADAVLLTGRTLQAKMQAAGLRKVATRHFLFSPWERTKPIDRLFAWLPLGAQYAMIAARD